MDGSWRCWRTAVPRPGRRWWSPRGGRFPPGGRAGGAAGDPGSPGRAVVGVRPGEGGGKPPVIVDGFFITGAVITLVSTIICVVAALIRQPPNDITILAVAAV